MSNSYWFFAPPDAWAKGEVVLPSDEAHHALRVLRINVPDVITVFDGNGRVARAGVTSAGEGEVRAEILDVTEHPVVKPQVVVYQGTAKSGKLDSVVERLAELGVAELWAFESERSVARWDAGKAEKLGERWAAIARSAAKQSRNPFFLKAGAGLSWTELVRRISKEPLAVTLWEEASLPLRAALPGHADRIALVVGPEGGFARSEAEALADAGSPLVSLGPRILRTENAGLVAASAVGYHFGSLG